MSRKVTRLACDPLGLPHARRPRGVTLIEMLVAMVVALLIVGCTLYLFLQSKYDMERPRASYSVQEDALSVARWLQNDLTETNLQSVASFPNAKYAAEPPGLSFESPRSLADNTLMVSTFGNVSWSKYVYYTLQPVDAQVGNLIRKEGPLSDQPAPVDAAHHIPQMSGLPPTQGGTSQPGANTTSRIVAHNVILPNASIPGVKPNPWDQYGGFKVSTGALGGAQVPLTGDPIVEAPIQIDIWVREISPSTQRVTVHGLRLDILPRN